MTSPHEQHSDALSSVLDLAERDERILGVVVSGSVARGMATEHSDVDAYVVTSETVPGWETVRTHEIDTIYMPLDELLDIPCDPGHWYDRWSFAYAQVLLDRGGIAEAVNAQARLTPQEVQACLGHYLDAYINYAYRSLKAHRDGRTFEQRLDAVESIRPLLWCVFAFHGRVRPYNKYLRWELTQHPFTDRIWSRAPLVQLLTEVLDNGDSAAQRALFALVEKDSRPRGFGELIDAWGDELTLLRE
jgi:predicted nucleotidyltransferase